MKQQHKESFTRIIEAPTKPTAGVRVYAMTLRLYTDRGGPLVARRKVATTGHADEAAARLFQYERDRYQRLFAQHGLTVEDYDIQEAALVAEAELSDVAAPAVVISAPPAGLEAR